MKPNSLSIRSVTSFIFAMLAVISIVLSWLAGDYFQNAAIKAQGKNLSRVIEVASYEILMQIKALSYDFGSKLSNDRQLLKLMKPDDGLIDKEKLAEFLDDPLLNGFVGFSKIDLRKLRVFNLDLELLSESRSGASSLKKTLNPYLVRRLSDSNSAERLKAIDSLWMSRERPLFSTLLPIGGLRPIGYLEVIIDPAFNLNKLADITQTPVSVSSAAGVREDKNEDLIQENLIPVEFQLKTSGGEPAFTIVGYEDITKMNEEMESALYKTIAGFFALTFLALLLALYIFRHLLFIPVSNMISDIKQISRGDFDKQIRDQGLHEFHLLANAFNSMTTKIKSRTADLQGLLDVDENVLMCFGSDDELIYFNKKTLSVFGYTAEELEKLYLSDLFSDDIELAVHMLEKNPDCNSNSIQSRVICKHKNHQHFRCTANIRSVYIRQQHGFAISINTSPSERNLLDEKDTKLLNVVEQAFSSDLDALVEEPALPLLPDSLKIQDVLSMQAGQRKHFVRDYVVRTMNAALTCWNQDLGKSKIELAEESKIWPVYIDKSTPTTRTLDKYLSLDHCPQNPRTQRVIDTAEFVLSKTADRDSENVLKLKNLLEDFRTLLTGIQ